MSSFLLTQSEFTQMRCDNSEFLHDRVLVLSQSDLSLWQKTSVSDVKDGQPSEPKTSGDGDGWICLETIEFRSSLPEITTNRGDSIDIVNIGGQSVLAVDDTGQIRAHLAPDELLSSLRHLSKESGTAIGDALGLTQPSRLHRGDNSHIITMNNTPVMAVQADGELLFRAAPQTLHHIADDLPMPGGRSVPPDAVARFDGWGARRDGDMIYFTGHVWGDYPREYVCRGSGEPWAVSVSDVPIRLISGGELADAPVSVPPDHFAHIHCFNDGAGCEGLGGEAAGDTEATDIERVSAGFGAVAADSYLRSRRGAKPLIGIRTEAVPGADLLELRSSQCLDNLTNAVTQFRRAVQPYGKRAFTDTVTILHGAGDDTVSYKDDLLALASDILQKTGARQVNLFQPVGTAFDPHIKTALATVEAFRERGRMPIVLIAPIYPAERCAGAMTQPTAESMTMLAELDGLAGPDWLPPLAFHAERDKNMIYVDFEVMSGCEIVAPEFGLQYADSNEVDIPIISATVVPDPVTNALTRLQIELERAPEMAGILRYACGNIKPSFDLSGSQFCSGGDLRDNWSAPSVTGKTLHRYALAFEFLV